MKINYGETNIEDYIEVDTMDDGRFRVILMFGVRYSGEADNFCFRGIGRVASKKEDIPKKKKMVKDALEMLESHDLILNRKPYQILLFKDLKYLRIE